MAANGITREVGEQIYTKLQAFADFGFPESHSFSFAYLVYASAWLKVHHPEAFYAALLASQPMGFYSPQTLLADARRHGVRILAADVTASGVQPRVEPGATPPGAVPTTPDGVPLVRPRADLAVQLGLAQVRTIGEERAAEIVAEREREPFTSLADLSRRVPLTREQLEALATAGALRAWGSRRENLWSAGALAHEHGVVHGTWLQPPLPGTAVGARPPALPGMDVVEEAVADVWATGVTPHTFPTRFVRPRLEASGVVAIAELERR